MLGCIQPMSSPMMNRMLGFPWGCCCANAGALAAPTATNASRPSQAFLVMLNPRFFQMTARAGPAVCAQGSSFIVGRRTTTAHRGRQHPWVAQGVGASSAGALRPFRRYENESGDHSPQIRITLDGDLACIVRKI